ncbi:MAG: hypothetical protein P4L36_18555 [Holophaga sp.]|nr:hypothetical protein [Holophaga sp.]
MIVRAAHETLLRLAKGFPVLAITITGPRQSGKTTLASWLLGIREPGQVAFHAQRGALFENLVVTEFLKSGCIRGSRPTCTSGGEARDWRWTSWWSGAEACIRWRSSQARPSRRISSTR